MISALWGRLKAQSKARKIMLEEVMAALLCATLLSLRIRCEPHNLKCYEYPLLHHFHRREKTDGQNSLLKSLNGTSVELAKITQDLTEQASLGEGQDFSCTHHPFLLPQSTKPGLEVPSTLSGISRWYNGKW